ncbi:hypothetical protein VNO77_02924 [Canavalia gladiata]|uniref:Uncharacterized protein n=1 Tax=Canavalia gladiata TaxID=3824 RepID=A0AAN9R6H9_CANGL
MCDDKGGLQKVEFSITIVVKFLQDQSLDSRFSIGLLNRNRPPANLHMNFHLQISEQDKTQCNSCAQLLAMYLVIKSQNRERKKHNQVLAGAKIFSGMISVIVFFCSLYTFEGFMGTIPIAWAPSPVCWSSTDDKKVDILEAFTDLHGYTYVRSDGSTELAPHARLTLVDPRLLQRA